MIRTIHMKVMALLLCALYIHSLYFNFIGYEESAVFLRTVLVIFELRMGSSGTKKPLVQVVQ